ncbi:hypothetical protein DEO72_LG4g1628 [Vigna unguiculata]|uniref:Uncharacterized protein n=1 Tax=Vigna unguiculata TaxID=3917 RepID=A0A4D6LQ59_VIGUN|nr:hypothetical protein DEO72_LG4g1627 [Vigna unguiculata]QCD90671.1 hypothetical protein DEO72_LG4g1628 [Vigna unguiculata]
MADFFLREYMPRFRINRGSKASWVLKTQIRCTVDASSTFEKSALPVPPCRSATTVDASSLFSPATYHRRYAAMPAFSTCCQRCASSDENNSCVTFGWGSSCCVSSRFVAGELLIVVVYWLFARDFGRSRC